MVLMVVGERAADGGPVLQEKERVQIKVPVKMVLGAEELGEGVLFVTTEQVAWINTSTESPSYSLDYPSIFLHAVSRDTANFPMPCVYCQLDGDDEEPSEVRFVPQDEEQLMPIYVAMSDCAVLHPDDDDEDDAGDMIYNADEVESGAQEAAAGAVLSHLESVMTVVEPSAAPATAPSGGDASSPAEDSDTQDARAAATASADATESAES